MLFRKKENPHSVQMTLCWTQCFHTLLVHRYWYIHFLINSNIKRIMWPKMWRWSSKQNETTPIGRGEDYIGGYRRRGEGQTTAVEGEMGEDCEKAWWMDNISTCSQQSHRKSVWPVWCETSSCEGDVSVSQWKLNWQYRQRWFPAPPPPAMGWRLSKSERSRGIYKAHQEACWHMAAQHSTHLGSEQTSQTQASPAHLHLQFEISEEWWELVCKSDET